MDPRSLTRRGKRGQPQNCSNPSMGVQTLNPFCLQVAIQLYGEANQRADSPRIAERGREWPDANVRLCEPTSQAAGLTRVTLVPSTPVASAIGSLCVTPGWEWGGLMNTRI